MEEKNYCTINVHLHLESKQHALSALLPLEKDLTVLTILENQRKKLIRYRSASTMANYKTAIQSLMEYLKDDIPLSDFNTDLICGYERWLLKKGCCLNTISCYLRSIRALTTAYNNHTKETFEKVFTGKTRTDKRSVPISVIHRLKNMSLPKGSFDELARDVFLFSFFAMGMPFVDVAYLKNSQITNGQILYKRQKTGRSVIVFLEPSMIDIINRHSPLAKNGFLFPLLTQGTEHEYQITLGRYNRALHRLQKLSGVNICLTSYVVRHTWASTAYQLNIDIPIISKALGHANPQTTLTYIREIDDQRLIQANRKIIDSVFCENI